MSFGKTINLGNSIIGVSILAMPYCFVQSGILLSILLIVLSGFLTRLSCHLLLKSALLSNHTSFELMAQEVLGTAGRLIAEIGVVGFLAGSCIGYFIMIGDLAPKILTELLYIKDDSNLRFITVITLSLFVALPLSLLKKIDSLTSLSVVSMILYSCLVLKLIFETNDKLNGDTPMLDDNNVTYWNLSNSLRTFPIFCMAMSCQTSLFEIFDNSTSNCDLETLKRDNNIIKKAIYLCSFVYITVGLLGYMAFHDQTLYGNILLAFPPSLTTTLTKLLFTISLLVSFPLCLFPCRTSVYSLTIGKVRESVKFQRLAAEDPQSPDVGRADDSSGNFKIGVENSNFNDDKNNNGAGDPIRTDHNSTNNGRYHYNLILPMFGKSIKQFAPTNQIRLKTILNGNGSSYTYTKLLSDDDNQTTLEHEFDNHCSLDDDTVTNDLIVYNHPTKIQMSDFHFRLLTVILIIITVMLSLLFPHIEFILGIIGSTAGTTVCFIMPAYTFIKIGKHSMLELWLARTMLIGGVLMFVLCTYATIQNANSDR
uniref:Putative sodium-coupled neutral amino acid transporter 10 n=1 Tax=Aceria tosichella TaxID=561515 RepID=A0A6G1SBM6_9ACAR